MVKIRQDKKGMKSAGRPEHYTKIMNEMRNRERYGRRHPNHLCTPQCPEFRK